MSDDIPRILMLTSDMRAQAFPSHHKTGQCPRCTKAAAGDRTCLDCLTQQLSIYTGKATARRFRKALHKAAAMEQAVHVEFIGQQIETISE